MFSLMQAQATSVSSERTALEGESPVSITNTLVSSVLFGAPKVPEPPNQVAVSPFQNTAGALANVK